MSLNTNAASAQRELIRSRVSSLRFESPNNNTSPSHQKTPTASGILFSPLHRAKSLSTDTIKHETQLMSTAERVTPTSIEVVTQKMTSTHLYPKKPTTNNPTTFPEPGKFIGKLGTRTPAKITIERRCKERNHKTSFSAKHSLDCSDISATVKESKKRRTGIFNRSDGWVLLSSSTLDKSNTIRSVSTKTRNSYSTATRKSSAKTQGSLGDVYDFQLNRLAMKPCDRYQYSPSNETKDDEDDKNSRSYFCFFSPIRCHPKDERNEEPSGNRFVDLSSLGDNETLLTPMEINFDNFYQEEKRMNKEEIEEVSIVNDNDGIFNDEEAPFAAFAREYFKD